MRYLSVCSGIEAATVAWHPLGWTPAAFSEIEPFPRAVLQHHYPEVPLHGDFTTIEGHEYGPIDLLVGGTPCQSFSVAGLRGGLDDDRGNLALEYLRLADRARPRWLVWENVPGVLSSNGGRDFGAILGGMVELGYGVAYRVLDAQFFRVAQRRRRVFVVGYAGDWRRAAAVLFERHSLSGHPAPSREAGQRATPPIAGCSNGGGANGPGRTADDADSLVAHAFDARQTDVIQYGDQTGPLDTDGWTMGVVTLAERGRPDGRNLEYRDDGTANAVLTPSGGRAGIGIGAVAYGLRNDAARTGEARTPSVDASGQVRLRDAGFNPLLERAPTLEAGTPHTVAVAYGIGSDAIDRTGEGASGLPGHRAGLNIVEEMQPSLRARPNNSVAVAFNITPSNSNKDYNARASERAQAITSGGNRPSARGGDLIAFAENQRNEVRELGVAGALAGIRRGDEKNETLLAASAVRRLTPRECERLQGFPDDYTAIAFRGKPAADGPRYKALGNSMAVPCMAWIGQRIAMVEARAILSALEERAG